MKKLSTLSKILYKVFINFTEYKNIVQNAKSRVKEKYLIQTFIDNIQKSYINSVCEK